LSTLWTLLLGLIGLLLTLKIFASIMSGEFALLAFHIKREDNERRFAIYMAVGMFVCLVLYLAALKTYLGPLSPI
jgi:uncharacterized membrane protein YoaK (UPF0700 family)